MRGCFMDGGVIGGAAAMSRLGSPRTKNQTSLAAGFGGLNGFAATEPCDCSAAGGEARGGGA